MQDSVIFSHHKKMQDEIFGVPAISSYHRNRVNNTTDSYTYNTPDTKTIVFKNFEDMCFLLDDEIPIPTPIKVHNHIGKDLLRKLVPDGFKPIGVFIVKYIYLDLGRDALRSMEYINATPDINSNMMEDIIECFENTEDDRVVLRFVEFISKDSLLRKSVYNRLSKCNVILGNPKRYRKNDKQKSTDENKTIITVSVGSEYNDTLWFNLGGKQIPLQPNKHTSGSSISITTNGYTAFKETKLESLEHYGFFKNKFLADNALKNPTNLDYKKLEIEHDKIKYEEKKLNNDKYLGYLAYKTKIITHLETISKLKLEKEKIILARVNTVKSTIEAGVKIISVISTLMKNN